LQLPLLQEQFVPAQLAGLPEVVVEPDEPHAVANKAAKRSDVVRRDLVVVMKKASVGRNRSGGDGGPPQ
jgi:hypothetical protein